ncbi:MAG: nuclear transport factor 2 family protein [Planctomycetota bacterium]|jgi:hypothetical protein
MHTKRSTLAVVALVVGALGMGWISDEPIQEGDVQVMTPEQVVRDVYAQVSFGPGTTPDWDKVRAHFLDEAVIVLRTGRETTAVFTLDGFVADFVAFIERTEADERGFTETVLSLHATVFGDIAHVLVLYEAQLQGSERGPSRGVDSFHLIRRGDRWSIVSILNELPSDERPVPAVLQR